MFNFRNKWSLHNVVWAGIEFNKILWMTGEKYSNGKYLIQLNQVAKGSLKTSCMLTVWGWITHIWISKLSYHLFRWLLVTYSVPSHHLYRFWHLVNWTPRNKLEGNLYHNTMIITLENAFENVICKMVAMLSQPQLANYDQYLLLHCGPFKLHILPGILMRCLKWGINGDYIECGVAKFE